MNKKMAAVLLSLAAAASLTACGQKAAQTAAAQTQTAAPQTQTAAAQTQTAAPQTQTAAAQAQTAAAQAQTAAAQAQTAAPQAETAAAQAQTKAAETAQAAEPPVQLKDQETCVLIRPVERKYYEGLQNEDNTHVYTLEASWLGLTEEDAAEYPNLDAGLGEDYCEYVQQKAAEFVDRFLEYSREGKIELEGTDPYVQKTAVIRMDDHMTSLLCSTYEYLGGAHGYTVFQSFNYNTQKKAWVQLSEIVRDNEKLQEILIKKLKEDYPENQYFDLEKDIKMYVPDQPAKDGKIAYTWTMDYDSLQIYFMEEALGPHANGAQIIDLAFADYPELLVNNYGSAPSDFARKMEAYAEYSMAGKQLKVEEHRDPDSLFLRLVFSVNGEESSFDTNADKAETWFVTGNGHSFFYVFTIGEDDEQLFTVYSIEGNKVVRLQQTHGHLPVEVTDVDEPIGKTAAGAAGYPRKPYARIWNCELPCDPAAIRVTIGEYGSEKDRIVSVEEDGTVTIK